MWKESQVRDDRPHLENHSWIPSESDTEDIEIWGYFRSNVLRSETASDTRATSNKLLCWWVPFSGSPYSESTVTEKERRGVGELRKSSTIVVKHIYFSEIRSHYSFSTNGEILFYKLAYSPVFMWYTHTYTYATCPTLKFTGNMLLAGRELIQFFFLMGGGGSHFSYWSAKCSSIPKVLKYI